MAKDFSPAGGVAGGVPHSGGRGAPEHMGESAARGPAADRSEVMTINIGPHHPATHGVLRLVVDLEGEVVRELRPVIGYVHTGIEKSCEDKSYWKVIPFVERMDYVSYFFQMEAFCGAVERLVDLEIPPRAKYLRTIFAELMRIHDHLLCAGAEVRTLPVIAFELLVRSRPTLRQRAVGWCSSRRRALRLRRVRTGGCGRRMEERRR